MKITKLKKYFSISAAEPRDVLVERHNRLSAAIRILNEAYQVSSKNPNETFWVIFRQRGRVDSFPKNFHSRERVFPKIFEPFPGINPTAWARFNPTMF